MDERDWRTNFPRLRLPGAEALLDGLADFVSIAPDASLAAVLIEETRGDRSDIDTLAGDWSRLGTDLQDAACHGDEPEI